MTKVIPKLLIKYSLAVCNGEFGFYEDRNYEDKVLLKSGNLSDLPRAACELIAKMEEEEMAKYYSVSAREEIDRLLKENAKLKKWRADTEEKFEIIMAEKCPSDEIHCACVPFLRMEIAELKESLKLNAAMLARQCDLAREAETKALIWLKQIEEIVNTPNMDLDGCERLQKIKEIIKTGRDTFKK